MKQRNNKNMICAAPSRRFLTDKKQNHVATDHLSTFLSTNTFCIFVNQNQSNLATNVQ